MQPISILVASADDSQRDFIAQQLDADGYAVHDSDSAPGAIAKLASQAIDVLLLGELATPADSPALLRAIRAGQHPRVHPAQPTVTLGASDDLTTLRAYETGSDHHLAADSAYVVLRAVLASVVRRTLHDVTSRHLHIGSLHIDTSACSVEVDGQPVRTSRIEFDLLAKLASDPTKVFTKNELKRAIGRDSSYSDRTVDSHVCRLRTRLASTDGGTWLPSTWGRGYSLLRAERS